MSARAGEVEEAEASGDASSLKSLATRLMRRVGASAGAPVAFDACAAAMKLGGVPAPDAPGAHGTGALAGAARRLHDVASILIRVGVLAFVEHEGKAKGRGDLKWLGARSVTARLAEGADGAVAEKGYGAGAAAAAKARGPGPREQRLRAHGVLRARGERLRREDGAIRRRSQRGGGEAGTRLSSFFQRAPAYAGLVPPAEAGGARAGARRVSSVSFGAEPLDRAGASIFSPPRRAGRPRDAADAAAAAAALMRSPEWIAQLSMATAGAPAGAGGALSAPSPAAGGLGAGALNPAWASPAAVAPLQALYAWYGGNAHRVGGKTDGEGAARRVETPASAGLSGLSSLFDGTHSPAEVEAAMHRETMHAAAAAAVQAAMGGVTAVPEGKGDPAMATRRREKTRRESRARRGGIRVSALKRGDYRFSATHERARAT